MALQVGCLLSKAALSPRTVAQAVEFTRLPWRHVLTRFLPSLRQSDCGLRPWSGALFLPGLFVLFEAAPKSKHQPLEEDLIMARLIDPPEDFNNSNTPGVPPGPPEALKRAIFHKRCFVLSTSICAALRGNPTKDLVAPRTRLRGRAAPPVDVPSHCWAFSTYTFNGFCEFTRVRCDCRFADLFLFTGE